MYKLVVVSGPNRSSSFILHEGENWIGRQPGCEVVLNANKVSKRHCVLIVSSEGVLLDDQKSSNGTFVNGKLVRSKPLSVGDRISVGEYVFELTRHVESQNAEAPPAGVVLDFPSARSGLMPRPQYPAVYNGPGGAAPNMYAPNPYAGPQAALQQHIPQADPNAAIGDNASAAAPAAPTDLKGRLLHLFDLRVMPFFYGLLLKNEWRVVCVGVFAVFLVLNLMVSVQPALDAGQEAVLKEVARRATFLAHQIAEKNGPYLAQRNESRTEIGGAEDAPGVRQALLIDLDNRIIAPGNRQNSYLSYGGEAIYAKKLRKELQKGDERDHWFPTDDSTVTAYVPVKVLNPAKAKNEVVAIAVVSIDTSQAVAGMGDVGVAYGETLIMTGLLAAFVLLILHRLTLKPFQVLVDDLDRALKGDLPQVTREFKLEEVEGLWDLVNSALQRLPKAGASEMGGLGGGSEGVNIDDLVAPFRALGEAGSVGVIVCGPDRRILFINEVFQEASGIRQESAQGQDIPSVARDQAMGALASDLFDRSLPGADPVSEDFDFSGVTYRVQGLALGSGGGQIRGYVLLASKAVAA